MIISRRIKELSRKKSTIVAYSNPESILSEKFRIIQTNINFLLSEQKKKIFIVSSPLDGDGKSTIIANLAASMAQQKKKVLLIDANLRNPSLHSFFKVTNLEGLTDVLIGRKNFNEVTNHTEVWRLDLMTSGHIPYNPVELLGSQGMKDLLKKAKEVYDFILIDTNALLDFPDTKLLANLSDGVILVVQSNKTKLKQVEEAKEAIEFAKAKLVGVVLNK